jgi:hypothetical protein
VLAPALPAGAVLGAVVVPAPLLVQAPMAKTASSARAPTRLGFVVVTRCFLLQVVAPWRGLGGQSLPVV